MVGLGMLVYAVIGSPGYYHNAPRMLGLFGVLFVLATIFIGIGLSIKEEG